MKKVKYAIIGFGGIAENRIAKEGFACDKSRFLPLKEVELVGVTDQNQERKSAADELGIKWYPSTDDVLNDNDIDAVFIATNNMSHAPIATSAMNAGKHCIIEKPMATTVEDARALSQLAESKSLSLAVDHMMTNNAYNIKAKDLIAQGIIGEVNDICLHMEFSYGSVEEEANTWRCSKHEELGGPIGDVASHCLYMGEFLLGSRINSLSCVYYPKTMGIEVEDGAYIKFQMENGKTGTVNVAFNEPRGGLVGTLSNLGCEVYGPEGVLRTYGSLFQISGHEDEPIAIRLEVQDGEAVKTYNNLSDIQNIYQTLITAHAKSILAGKPMNCQDGIHNLELVMAAHESARNNGKKVEMA